MDINEVHEITLRKLGAPREVGPAISPQLREAEPILDKLSREERARLLEQLAYQTGAHK